MIKSLTEDKIYTDCENKKKLSILIFRGLFCFFFLILLFSEIFYSQVSATELNGLANSAWPCWGHDSMHTGRSPNLGVQTNSLKWIYRPEKKMAEDEWEVYSLSIYSSPVIGIDRVVYIGNYALNPEDGTLKWSHQIGVRGAPAIGIDGTVYIGTFYDDWAGDGKNNIFAFDPNGSLKWSYQAEASGGSAAIAYDGTAYFVSTSGKIYALDINGRLKWSYQIEGTVSSSPAISIDGTIYVGSSHVEYVESEIESSGKVYSLDPNGSLKWSYQTGGAVNSSPAIATDGTIYIGSDDGKIYALNPQDGSPKWSSQTGRAVSSSPAIGVDGTVYIGSDDCKLYALNTDGSRKWSYQTGGEIRSSPAIGADGTIYFGSGDGKVYALGSDGSQKWSYQTGGAVYSSPAIATDGTVYIGSSDGKVYAFGKDTNPPEIICPSDITVPASGILTEVTYGVIAIDNVDPWPVLVFDPSSGSKFPIGTTLVKVTATDYLGNFSNCTFNVTIEDTNVEPQGLAISAWPCRGHDSKRTGQSPYLGVQTNTLKWSYQTVYRGVDNSSSPAIAVDGTVYLGSEDGKVYALGAAGNLKWIYQTEGEINSSPAIAADGTVYIGSNDYKIYALSPDGSLKWGYRTEGEVRSSPAIATDGTIYIGSNDGKVYALEPDGNLKWDYQTGGEVSSSPAVATDGTIYIGSCDRYVYAFNTDGSLKWSYLTEDDVKSSPAIAADGTIYYIIGGEFGGYVYALSPDGRLKWIYQKSVCTYSLAIGADGTIYTGSWDCKIYALNPDGNLKWSYQFDPEGWAYSVPAIGADGTIYICLGDTHVAVYALAPKNNILKWSYQTTRGIYSSPAIGADGTVYVVSGDGKVYAFGNKGTGEDIHPSKGTDSSKGSCFITSMHIPLWEYIRDISQRTRESLK